MNEYEIQARKWLKETGSSLKIEFVALDYHFSNDKEKRNIFDVTLSNKKGHYRFRFGTSINNTYRKTFNGQLIHIKKKPTNYSILASLGFYYPSDFDEFIMEFGYIFDTEKEYIEVKAIHQACLDEKQALRKMYSQSELEQLAEIN
ncbi:MAG TPA: hypothetical protein ENJ44_05860 [Oceanospirillales bacterium]|nr:hypothetical protein [Oceanospirillales bacterium]